MSLVKTNQISLSAAIEASLGTLPGSPAWALMEPNTINKFGASITKVARSPISRLRQRRKGTTTDLESSVEFECDFTGSAFKYLARGVVQAAWTSPAAIQAGALFQTLAAVATGNKYTHSAITAAIPVGRLVYARGFSTAGNNGLGVVNGSPSTTQTPVSGLTLADETPSNASGALLELAGVRSAVGDLDITVSGTTGTLTSTTLDFTTLGVMAGQLIYIGGLTSTNRFASGRHGAARIVSVAAHSMALDKIRTSPAATTLQTEANTTQALDLLFGRFLRNVDVEHADYLQQSFQFEAAYPDLNGLGSDGYEYAAGNYIDTMSVNMPGQDKATVTFGCIGTDTAAATTSRASGASTPVQPVETEAMNTSSDIARLRVEIADHTGLSTCFKSLTVTLANGVTREKCLGSLGSLGLNTGNFLVDIQAKATFDNIAVTSAIRDNATVSMDWVLRNGDGAVGFDLPSMTLGDGAKELPVGESVLISLKGEVFADPILGTSIGVSLFPAFPTDPN